MKKCLKFSTSDWFMNYILNDIILINAGKVSTVTPSWFASVVALDLVDLIQSDLVVSKSGHVFHKGMFL